MKTVGALPAALKSARRRLKLQQKDIARHANVSTRTITRWETGERYPDDLSLRSLVTAMLHFDTAAAEEVARAAHSSLASMGLARAAPGAGLVDAVLCAAAEAMDTSPRAMRSALLATFRRMKELGVTVDVALRELSPPPKA